MTPQIEMAEPDFKVPLFRKAEFLGCKALFTDFRVAREVVPNGVAVYDLREGEGLEYNEYGEPIPPSLSIAPSVVIDHFGTILMMEKFKLVEREECVLAEDDWFFAGTEISLEEGISWLKNGEPFGVSD